MLFAHCPPTACFLYTEILHINLDLSEVFNKAEFYLHLHPAFLTEYFTIPWMQQMTLSGTRH